MSVKELESKLYVAWRNMNDCHNYKDNDILGHYARKDDYYKEFERIRTLFQVLSRIKQQ